MFFPQHFPIEKNAGKAWLINTGWTGGAFGTGHRMSLKAAVMGILN